MEFRSFQIEIKQANHFIDAPICQLCPEKYTYVTSCCRKQTANRLAVNPDDDTRLAVNYI
jgi:hypothetical protein